MSTVRRPDKAGRVAPPLATGDQLDQPTFHQRYQAMPPGARAELIQGVVSMPSPLGVDHGAAVVTFILWLGHYAECSPGLELLDNATVILDGRNEVQPDVTLRVLPGLGGRTRDENGFVAGPPELVVEVARSSRYLDLGPKRDEYERAGVLEYVVRTFEPDEVLWQVARDGHFEPLLPDADGLHRSRVFPGLWLDPRALLARDTRRLREVVELGVATPEHAAFVARLAAARPTA
jgi:Uma2 family endonuclease